MRLIKKWNREKLKIFQQTWKHKIKKNAHNFRIKEEKYLKQITELNAELQNQKMQYESILDKMFTPGQKSMLLNEKSKTHYTNIDISKALSLKFISQRAYDYVRDIWNLPLPSSRTLRM